jgi:hypothetical protein
MKIMFNGQEIGDEQKTFSESTRSRAMFGGADLSPIPHDISDAEVEIFGTLGDVQSEIDSMSNNRNMPHVEVPHQFPFGFRLRFQNGYTIQGGNTFAGVQNVTFPRAFIQMPFIAFGGFQNVDGAAQPESVDIVKNDIAINNFSATGFQWAAITLGRSNRRWLAWGYS